MRLLFLFITFSFLTACAPKEAKEKKPESLGQILPEPALAELLIKSTNIDIVFFSLPISVNQDEKSSVNRTLEFITRDPVLVSEKCPAIGRMTVIDNGDVLRDIDLHYGAHCAYYCIYENNKPTYYSQMSQEGKNFMNNLFAQTGIKVQ